MTTEHMLSLSVLFTEGADSEGREGGKGTWSGSMAMHVCTCTCWHVWLYMQHILHLCGCITCTCTGGMHACTCMYLIAVSILAIVKFRLAESRSPKRSEFTT